MYLCIEFKTKQYGIKKSHLRKLKLSIDIDSVNIYVELGVLTYILPIG
jgi:hypothetical protein